LVDDILQAAGHDERFHVICGAGGMGNSAIALEIAFQYSRTGRRAWWISGQDVSQIPDVFLDIACRDLGVTGQEASDARTGNISIIDLFWRKLLMENEWLIVFDNVDDPYALAAGVATPDTGQSFIRPAKKGLVLVTSRAAGTDFWGASGVVHTISELSPDDGAQVLCDLAPQGGSWDEAQALSRRLGGLPLALTQAGAYLAGPFARTRRFEEYRLRVGPGGPVGRTVTSEERVRETIETTWDLSLTLLKNTGYKEARTLLELLSCFAAGLPIPMTVFESLRMRKLLGKSWDGSLEGFAALYSQSLIYVKEDVETGAKLLSIHPVVSDLYWSRAVNRLENPKLRFGSHGLINVGAFVGTTAARLLSDIEYDEGFDKRLYRYLQPHLRQLLIDGPSFLVDDDLAALIRAALMIPQKEHVYFDTLLHLEKTFPFAARALTRFGPDPMWGMANMNMRFAERTTAGSYRSGYRSLVS
jgi:hypothetical protein